MSTKCIYCSEMQYYSYKLSKKFIPDDAIIFPDYGLMYDDVRKIPRYDDRMVFTSNPIVCTNYEEHELFKIENGEIVPMNVNVYGAGYEVAVRQLHTDVHCSLSQHIVDKIRSKLDISDQCAYDYIKSLSESMERSYMLKKLENDMEKSNNA